MGLLGKLTDVGVGAEWHSQPGRGRFNLEADLLARPEAEGYSPPLSCCFPSGESCAMGRTAPEPSCTCTSTCP